MIPTSKTVRFSNIMTVLTGLITLTMVAACGKKDSGNSASQNPPPIVDLAGSYDGQVLNPRQALDDRMGRWEQVDGEFYFVPDLTLVDDSQDWEPYQHGYWTWDDEDNRGWTWVSHEPWGWMTEHYGVWRHHRRLGWIWMPFDDMEYQPHGVTWFDDGDYVGWYPYHRRYANGYRQHPDFNDGFWDVNYAAVNFGTGNSNFRLGVTVVLRENVTRENIRRYRVSDRRQIHYLTRRVHTDPVVRARVSFSPGGLNGYLAFDFIQKQSRHKAHRGKSRLVISKGGAKFIQPYRHVDTPVEYRRRWSTRAQKHDKRHGMPGRKNFERQNNRRANDHRFNDSVDRQQDDTNKGGGDRGRGRDQKRSFQPQVLPPVKTPQLKTPEVKTPIMKTPEVQTPPAKKPTDVKREERRFRGKDEKRVRPVLPKVETSVTETPAPSAPKVELPAVIEKPVTPALETSKKEGRRDENRRLEQKEKRDDEGQRRGRDRKGEKEESEDTEAQPAD